MSNSLDKPVEYMKDTPVNIGVYEIEYCPIHTHRDIEIMYVLKGSVALKFSTYDIYLEEGDLFIINTNYLHDIRGLTEDHQMILMRVDIGHYMDKYKDLDVMAFTSDMSSKSAIEQVKKNLIEVYKLSRAGGDVRDMVMELTDNIMSIFVNEFHLPSDDENNKSENTIRIEKAQKQLLGTEDPIEKIATDCGFSSVADCINEFKEAFGDTPEEHRNKMLPFTIANLDITGKPLEQNVLTDH